MPRLDVTFKKGPTPKERGVIPEIRQYWKSFCLLLRSTYIEGGHKARLIEVPLWQITIDLVNETSTEADIIYIPHKMKLNWNLDNRVRYYMQMVIPNIFSIDRQGWCASSSTWPISAQLKSTKQVDQDPFAILSARASENISKFKQPPSSSLSLPSNFVLFPCQIPHDETIIFHSDVSVEWALESLLLSMKHNTSYNVVVKSHPANLSSMLSLKKIVAKYQSTLFPTLSSRIQWLDNVSIHELLRRCIGVVTVNSGVGLEALLHYKKVYTFGNSDYLSASTKIMSGGSLLHASMAIANALKELPMNSAQKQYHESICRSFINNWYYSHYDSLNKATFKKVLKH